MSVSLLTPDLRRILGELTRRVGILERRVTQPGPAAPVSNKVRRFAAVEVRLGPVEGFWDSIELVPPLGNLFGSGLLVTIPGGPITLTANQTIEPIIWAPTYDLGTFTFEANLIVYNPAVTERTRVSYADTIASGATWTPTGSTGIDLTIGSDLSVTSGVVKTTAGGIYLANLYVNFGAVPD